MKNSWAVKIWSEGKHFDLWHINHFLAGLLLGCGVIVLGLGFWFGFFVAVTLMFAWEIFELVQGIDETVFNAVMDVVLGIVAFFLIIYIKNNYLSDAHFYIVFSISAFVYAVLQLWGYWAYRVRTGK